MMKNFNPTSPENGSGLSRRSFLKSTAFATAAAALSGPLSAKQAPGRIRQYDAKGLPTTVFGKTGIRLPRICFGTGSRFNNATNNITGPRLLEKALDNGVYYWDGASNYGTEHRLGEVLKDRRNEVFLSSKVQDRSVAAARRSIDQSFVNLKTDYIDLYNVHSVDSMSVAQNLGPIFDLLHEYKANGQIGYIGFSGHSSAAAMRYVAQNYDVDAMIIALNHYAPGQAFEEAAVPVAACLGLGISVIKAIRPRENNPSLTVESLLRYSLSLEHVNTVIIGIDSEKVLMEDVELMKKFTPMNESEMQTMHVAMAPFYRSENVAWMDPAYSDRQGGWC